MSKFIAKKNGKEEVSHDIDHISFNIVGKYGIDLDNETIID
jgi:hypothetical protein